MLSEPDLLTSMRIISANASCKVVEIEGTKVALISAYFPPGNERSRSTIIAVENIMEKLKGLPTILAADFNSIPTSEWYDYQGDLLAPTDLFRQELQEFLQRWGWRDLLNFPQVEKGKMGMGQVTHWNQDQTRGKRLDRVYVNFDTSMNIKVETFYHPWTDHMGVLYKIGGENAAKKEGKPRNKVHSATFHMPHIKQYTPSRWV